MLEAKLQVRPVPSGSTLIFFTTPSSTNIEYLQHDIKYKIIYCHDLQANQLKPRQTTTHQILKTHMINMLSVENDPKQNRIMTLNKKHIQLAFLNFKFNRLIHLNLKKTRNYYLLDRLFPSTCTIWSLSSNKSTSWGAETAKTDEYTSSSHTT